MDIIFGSYVCSDYEPKEFGIKEEFPATYKVQMLEPIVPRRLWNKLTKRTN